MSPSVPSIDAMRQALGRPTMIIAGEQAFKLTRLFCAAYKTAVPGTSATRAYKTSHTPAVLEAAQELVASGQAALINGSYHLPIEVFISTIIPACGDAKLVNFPHGPPIDVTLEHERTLARRAQQHEIALAKEAGWIQLRLLKERNAHEIAITELRARIPNLP